MDGGAAVEGNAQFQQPVTQRNATQRYASVPQRNAVERRRLSVTVNRAARTD